MSKLTLDNYHIITGQRFRMLKEQKARGLTREQAFNETHGETTPLAEKKDIPAPPVILTPAPIEVRDLLSEARKLAEREKMTYSKLKRELRITWQKSSELMEALYRA